MKKATRNSTKLVWIIGLLLITLFLGGVYFVTQSNNESASSENAPTANTVQPAENTETAEGNSASGTIIKTGNSEYGPMLFDSRGQAIYIFELEESATAECYGSCAKAWPPVLTDGAPIASGDVDSSLLGTTKRTDGTTQVTYNGHPLYFYANEGPGEVECHNIKTHGGLWWVVQPNGNRAP